MAELQAAIDDANRHLKGTDNDSKVSALQALEQKISNTTGSDVDSTALESIASLLKLSLRNGNSHVYTAGLLCTLALFTIADEHWHTLKKEGHSTSQFDIIIKNAVNTLALPPGGLITFLGDAKDSARATARAALLQAAKLGVALSTTESRLQPDQQPLAVLDKLIKEQGFASKNAKIREQSITYLTELRAACPNLPLRGWVPILVNALEDSDPVVRDVAKEGVITTFTAATVGPAAKSDLKKELLKQGVRKTTSDIVLKRTLGNGLPSSSSSLTGSPPSVNGIASDAMSGGRRTPSMIGRPPQRPPSVASMGRSPSSGSLPRLSTGTSSGSFKPSRGDKLLKEPKNKTHEELLADLEAVAAANAPPPSTGESNVVQVVYIASVRDLEQEFAAMQPCFVGKETEFNWQDREKAIFRIRGMIKGNVHQAYRTAFVAGLKTAVDNILKAVNSLRTTLAAAACQLIGELASNLKDGLSTLFEPLFAGLIKLASLTKKPIAQAAQDSAAIMLRDCPYYHKTLPLLAAMIDQKNGAARMYISQHLKTFVEAHAKVNKEAIETSPNAGPVLLSQMLKKELADANASVRETARATFWLVYEIWPELGQTMMQSVDSATRKGLEKADNRGALRQPAHEQQHSTVASTKKAASGRPSMRDLINSRRAAQASSTNSNGLSASTSASSMSQPPSELARTTPRSRPVESSSRSSTPSPPPSIARPRLSTSATSPSRRPASIYSSHATSYIPSPPRSNQHSPRTRTFSGDLGQRRSMSHTYMSPPRQTGLQPSFDDSRTPTQTVFPSRRQSEERMSRSRSSSPPLRAPPADSEYSDIEASTFNAMPDGLESTDDESVNLMKYNATVLRPLKHYEADFDLSERSRILDGLMDTSYEANGSIEVEEAVKGLADQAEQTAHRFLELTEPDGQTDVGDTTVLEQPYPPADEKSSRDIPVPYTPEGKGRSEQNGAYVGEQTSNMTPLLQKFQSLHLNDSPANGGLARPTSTFLTNFTQDEWWITKADCTYLAKCFGGRRADCDAVALSKVQSVTPGCSGQNELNTLVAALERKSITREQLLRIGRLSKDLPVQHDTEPMASMWQEGNVYGRMVDGLAKSLRNSKDDDYSFDCLVALLHLVTCQPALLNGRELSLLEVLFVVSRTRDKSVRTGAECVALGVVASTEPLYAASCIRVCLEGLQDPSSASETTKEADEMYGWTFAMGLKAMGALFSLLPAEVLEEEIVRSRELIKKALNSSQAALRQTAAMVLVKAHSVIQDDTKLFGLIEGLSISQINLCTYLFARSATSS